jgi:hypothetical protein
MNLIFHRLFVVTVTLKTISCIDSDGEIGNNK